MSNDKEKAVHEKAVEYLNKYMSVLDVVDDGLMKAHELLGAAESTIMDITSGAQNLVWDLSEKLSKYRDEVWERVQEDEDALYGNEPKDGCPSDMQEKPYPDNGKTHEEEFGTKPIKPTDDMSRQEKIDYVIDGYGLERSQAQLDAFKGASDATLNYAVNTLRRRKGE
jgi:hypothetical protein